MPGIFGVLDLAPAPGETRAQELRAVVERMAAAMLYDRGYCSTIVESPALGAYFGRVVLDPTRKANRIRVVANTGTPAVSVGDAADCDQRGTNFSWSTLADDAIARGVERRGIDALADLGGIRGAFVANHHTRACVLFNDKYGKERVFLHVARDRVLFSSEAKAILAVAPETRAFDARGLAEMLTCGCTIGDRSLFAGIDVLPSGTAVIFERGSLRRVRYFDRSVLEHLPAKSESDFLAEFPERLGAAVEQALRREPNPAVSLTGGIDSRMLLAAADPSATIPTYTFGSMYRITADVAVARRVATACGQTHSTIELGLDFLKRLPDVFSEAVYISDGYIGLSGAAELYVNRKAQSISYSRMTGNWGGEVMRGVRAFKAVMPKGGFGTPELAREMGGCAERLADAPQHPMSACLFQQMPQQGYGRNAIERSQMAMRHPFLNDDVVRCLFASPAQTRRTNVTAVAVLSRRPSLLTIPTDRGVLVHRASGVRRAAREALIKAEYMTSHGAPGWVARLSSAVPSALLETRFLGIDKFQHFRFWMRRDLAAFVRETLHASALERWFDRRRLEQMAEDHISGRDNYTSELDTVLTLATTQDILFRDAVVKAA